MRIVKLEEFLTLPQGTVFSKFRPQIFDFPQIKLASMGEIDFCSFELDHWPECNDSNEHHDIIHKMEQDPTFEHPLTFDVTGRDGCFERDQLFAIWDDADVQGLIERLQWSIVKKKEGVV